MIQSVETCANVPEMIPEVMAAVAENMKNETCAGELAMHRSKSIRSRDILRPEHLILSAAAAKTVIRAASGRNAERNCSINNFHFLIKLKYAIMLSTEYYHY